jgi:hypothetical protein
VCGTHKVIAWLLRGQDEPASGSQDEPASGGHDEPTSDGRDERAGGGCDERTGGGRDEPAYGGQDEPAYGANTSLHMNIRVPRSVRFGAYHNDTMHISRFVNKCSYRSKLQFLT